MVKDLQPQKDPAAQDLGRRGGLARKRALSPERIIEIARLAGKASAEKRRREKNENGRYKDK